MPKNIFKTLVLLLFVSLFISACASSGADEAAGNTAGNQTAVAALQKSGCTACHVIPGVPGAVGNIGPDLSEMRTVAEEYIQSDAYTGHATTVDEYVRESILEPNIFIVPECPNGPCQPGQMPENLANLITDGELDAVVQYLAALPQGENSQPETEPTPEAEPETPPQGEQMPSGAAPSLTEEEFTKATQIFFALPARSLFVIPG
jgi:nitrite reductase (NO-forming)/hydroxylamine reductase